MGLKSIALSRARTAVMAAGCAIALAGCLPGGGGGMLVGEKATRPLSSEMVDLIQKKGMSKETPVLVRIFKEESELEIWKQTTEGRYELLKSYPICRWSGELGPKIKTGDRQAPEGFYTITPGLMNPNSSYYLAFNMGFPNAFDRALGRTGANLMVHGDCSSSGCYAMTDDQIGEIFALARESFEGGQRSFQVQAYPFRMTPANLAKHRDNPNMAFWKMLKEGNDHFEVTRQEPKVDVCDKRYVFNAIPFDPAESFNAQRSCPVYDQPVEVVEAVRAKREADNKEYASLVARGTKTAPVLTYRDGGMNPVFASKFPERNPNAQQTVALPSLPQTAPDTAQDVTSSAPKKAPAVATAAVEEPRKNGSADQKASASPAPQGRLSKLGAWLGISKKDEAKKHEEPKQQANAQPKAQPAVQRTSPSDSPAARAIPTAKPAQDDDSGTMKGATPILSAGGLSYR